MQTKDRVLQIKKCLIFRSVGHACVKHSAVPIEHLQQTANTADISYPAYCNVSVYATFRENTRNYNVKKFQFSYYQLILFLFTMRGALAQPCQLHHEHCHWPSEPFLTSLEPAQRPTELSFILYLDELFQSPLCIIYFVHQFWPDCYDHVSKEGAGIDHRVTCPYFYSEWNASQYHICLSLQTAVSIVTYALFLFSIVKISATFHIIALIEIH